jgi:hypothetical protein
VSRIIIIDSSSLLLLLLLWRSWRVWHATHHATHHASMAGSSVRSARRVSRGQCAHAEIVFGHGARAQIDELVAQVRGL